MPLFDSFADIPPERRWRKQALPAPIVVAIIGRRIAGPNGRAQTSYLLIHRNAEPYCGRWALVGGKWDFGESLAAAAVREVREETGLETAYVALRGIVSERMAPAGADEPGAAHFLLLVVELDVQSGNASEQQEGAVEWFAPEQIELLYQKQAIIASDYEMLQRFAGAAEIPHFEAEMVTEPSGVTRLARFEEAR